MVGAMQLQWIGCGNPQSYWLKEDPRNSFIRAGSDGRNTVQSQADQCVRVPYAEVAARLFFFFLRFEPVIH